jgi:hypothetical protein
MDDVEIYDPNGEFLFTLRRGMGVMKALGKVAKALTIEHLFEPFRNRHSMIFQNNKLSGTLHLSIHPLDYMTMSDNEHNWSSCMSWRNEGGYRAGTVEMMNSSFVVVAYFTTGATLALPNGNPWNSKAWRTLLVVHPNFITSVKGYPYQSAELASAALTFLGNTLGTYDTSNIISFSEEEDEYSFDVPYHDDYIRIEYITGGFMYNDFGSARHYHIWTNTKNLNPSHSLSVDYCGPHVCMECGDDIECSWDDDDSGVVVCDYCSRASAVCPYCGARHLIDDMIWTDEGYVCEHCYEEEMEIDFIYEERIFRHNLTLIELRADPTTESYFSIWLPSHFIYSMRWSDYFNIPSPRVDTSGTKYFLPQDLTPFANDKILYWN